MDTMEPNVPYHFGPDRLRTVSAAPHFCHVFEAVDAKYLHSNVGQHSLPCTRACRSSNCGRRQHPKSSTVMLCECDFVNA